MSTEKRFGLENLSEMTRRTILKELHERRNYLTEQLTQNAAEIGYFTSLSKKPQQGEMIFDSTPPAKEKKQPKRTNGKGGKVYRRFAGLQHAITEYLKDQDVVTVENVFQALEKKTGQSFSGYRRSKLKPDVLRRAMKANGFDLQHDDKGKPFFKKNKKQGGDA